MQPLHPAAVQRMQLSEPWPLEQRAAMHISAADFSARDVSAVSSQYTRNRGLAAAHDTRCCGHCASLTRRQASTARWAVCSYSMHLSVVCCSSFSSRQSWHLQSAERRWNLAARGGLTLVWAVSLRRETWFVPAKPFFLIRNTSANHQFVLYSVVFMK